MQAEALRRCHVAGRRHAFFHDGADARAAAGGETVLAGGFHQHHRRRRPACQLNEEAHVVVVGGDVAHLDHRAAAFSRPARFRLALLALDMDHRATAGRAIGDRVHQRLAGAAVAELRLAEDFDLPGVANRRRIERAQLKPRLLIAVVLQPPARSDVVVLQAAVDGDAVRFNARRSHLPDVKPALALLGVIDPAAGLQISLAHIEARVVRDQRVFAVFQTQRIDDPLSVRDVARMVAVLDPAVVNERLAAARQVQHHAAAAVLRVKVRELDSGAVIPGARFAA